MKNTLIALLLGACASTAPPTACPKCYDIDEVAPYESPQRMIILCDERADAGPDAAAVLDETGPIQF